MQRAITIQISHNGFIPPPRVSLLIDIGIRNYDLDNIGILDWVKSQYGTSQCPESEGSAWPLVRVARATSDRLDPGYKRT